MFGTNFPQSEWKECVERVGTHLVEGKGGLRKEVVADFMGGNARRVFKLPDIGFNGSKQKALL